jgi:hypothetical protein
MRRPVRALFFIGLVGLAAPALATDDDTVAPSDAETAAARDKKIAALEEQLRAAAPGERRFLAGGYGHAGFQAGPDGTRALAAGFSPILLWRLSDRLFAQGELELEVMGFGTEVGVELVELSYLANDHLALSAGKFLVPFGLFGERLHPRWINKLPDAPLGLGDERVAPEEMVGAEARGAFALGTARLAWAVYAGSGPRLQMGDGGGGVYGTGTLDFDQFTDARNWSAGAFVGCFPAPWLELDYSILWARVGAPGSTSADATALLHALALTYQRDSALLQGRLELRGEWMHSAVDSVIYDPRGLLGFGPTAFDNRRSAGYAQLSYRPSRAENDLLRRLEPVVRWSFFTRPRAAPENTASSQLAVGLDVWLGSTTVWKLAYEMNASDWRDGHASSTNAFLTQLAMGF